MQIKERKNKYMNKVQVITKVPNVDLDQGNLCDEMFIEDLSEMNNDKIFRPFNDFDKKNQPKTISVNLEVFSLGEIIVVDKSSREIGGWGRKADKWFVEYKEFALKDINKAIRLSRKLISNK